MSRQDANAAFARTSFLYGGNAAYIEDLYARYESDPAAVDGEWRAFFESLRDGPAEVLKSAQGPSWKRADWPIPARDELVSALDGNWALVEKHVESRLQLTAVPGGTVGVGQEAVDGLKPLVAIDRKLNRASAVVDRHGDGSRSSRVARPVARNR